MCLGVVYRGENDVYSVTLSKLKNIPDHSGNRMYGAYVSVLAWRCSFKIRPTHRSIDDTLIQPKFVG